MKRDLVRIAIVSVCIVLGACGSGALSKPEFITKANAICADADRQTKALGNVQNAQQIPAFAEKVIPLAQTELSKLRALKPPDKDKAAVAEILSAFEAEIPMVQSLSDAVKAGNGVRFTQVGAQLDDQEKKANDLAKAYGLSECGKTTG